MTLPSPETVTTVAILGAGTIGASWAALFAARGLTVRVWDPAEGFEQRTIAAIETAKPALLALGLTVDGGAFDAVSYHGTPERACLGAGFIQESAPERLEPKRGLFAEIASAVGTDTVIASSTSGLLMSTIQEGLPFADRMVVGHPFNPPHLIPLVEVVGGQATDPAAIDWLMAFYAAHGKKPIRLHKEVPGHMVNRIQAALWREAVSAVDSGLASVADVDAAIAYGPGLRWAIQGPHLTFALAGGAGGFAHFLEHFGPGIEDWWADMSTPKLTTELRQQLSDGVSDEAAGRDPLALAAERDAGLIAIQRALKNIR